MKFKTTVRWWSVYLGDCREAGEIYIIQAIDFAIEQLASESNEVPVYQDAIEYGGGLK